MLFRRFQCFWVDSPKAHIKKRLNLGFRTIEFEFYQNRKLILFSPTEAYHYFIFLKTTQALCPPNPNVLLIPTLTTFFTALLKDRKSTRLNSSHVAISYAVFCLKK